MDRKRIVLEVVAEVSGKKVEELEAASELVAHLGIDSPKALQLLVELEDRLEIEIDDSEVAKLATVGDLLAAVERLPAS